MASVCMWMLRGRLRDSDVCNGQTVSSRDLPGWPISTLASVVKGACWSYQETPTFLVMATLLEVPLGPCLPALLLLLAAATSQPRPRA